MNRLTHVLALVVLSFCSSRGAVAQEGKDLLGDPLPREAVARIGTSRAKEQIPADFSSALSLRGAALSADGKTLATYGEPSNPKEGRPIQIWDARTGKLLHKLDGHEWPIRAIAISPDGKTLVSSSFDISQGSGITRVWDLKTGTALHLIPDGGHFVRFTNEGANFWLVVRDRLLVYQAKTGQEVRRFLGPNIPLEISEDGRFALGVSHTRDTVLRMYDLNNHQEILKLEGSEEAPKLARFSPDGNTVAAIDRSANIKVWEVATGRIVHELSGHKGRLFALSFSPDGRFLVSGGLDKTVRIWEIATGKEVHQLAGHQGIVTVLGFADRSGRLVSGSTDRSALVWDTANSLVSQLEIPKLEEGVLKSLWHDLSAGAPSRAYLAAGILAAAKEETFPFLHQQMEGLLIPSKNNRIEKLLKELDHDDSLVRHRAMKELRKLRQIAQPLLLKVLKETKSAEVRARLRYILSGTDNVTRFNDSDKLRMRRLIQLAEQADTPTARITLELLAAKCPIEPIAKEAERVLTKLETSPR